MLAEAECDCEMRCTKPVVLKTGMEVPCGKCLDCRIGRTSEWVTRIMHEAHGKDGVFVTLTYNDENLPVGGTLVKSDLQKFFKRLRKYLGEQKIKYFGCGEYGETTQRPHYHAVIIGWKPDLDECYKPDRKKVVSKQIERLWTFGNNVVGQVERKSVQYVTGYIRKKLYAKGTNPYAPRLAPFQLQSQGIGKDYAMQYKDQIFGRGITRDGNKVGIPRYYKKKLVDKGSDLDYKIREEANKRMLEKMLPYYNSLDEAEDDYEDTMNRLKDNIFTDVSIKRRNYLLAKTSDEVRRNKDGEAREKMFKKGRL